MGSSVLPKTIIVGGGNWGAAASYALIEAFPAMDISLVDACPFPSTRDCLSRYPTK